MLESGGGGLVSTTHDYMRFCRMMLNGGALDGVQILSPKTVELFSLNHLPDDQELADDGPARACSARPAIRASASRSAAASTSTSPRPACRARSASIFWGGAASTAFWIDPKEDLTVVFMTQVIGTDARLTLRRDLRTLVYSAMTELFA